MKSFLSVLLVSAVLVGCQAPVVAPTVSTTDPSYAFGVSIGANLAKTRVAFDWAAFEKGVKEGYTGTSTLTAAEVSKSVEATLTEARTKRAGDNALAEQAFFESNARKPGMLKTITGLQYEILTPGTGRQPTIQDSVAVQYKGTLISGTVFEDTAGRKEPVVVPVLKLLPGFAEGIRLMSAGAKFRFYIPSVLAYGGKGRGETIEPNAPLIYEVTLLSISPAKK